MKTWVLACLITQQGILECHSGPNICAGGKGGWLSITSASELMQVKVHRRALPSAFIGPLLSRLDHHRTTEQLLRAGSWRDYCSGLLCLFSSSNVTDTPRITVERKCFPCCVNRKVPKPSQDTGMCSLNPVVETPNSILSRAKPLLTWYLWC